MTLLHVSPFFFFIIGSAVGSFLFLIAVRWTKERTWRSLAYPPSYCDYCRKTLSWYELIPVFSYIFLRGKCSFCGTRIPATGFYAEVVSGILYVLAFSLFGWRSELYIALILFTLLSLFTWTDILDRIIPNPFVLIGVVIATSARLFIGELPYFDYILGGLVGFGTLALISLVSKGGMGGGDIKLFSMIGFFIGWKGVLLSLVFSSLVGSIYGVAMMANQRKLERKMVIPFAPSIMVGTVAAYSWGDQWIQWYIDWVTAIATY
jgi:leader peptidase (prepilin peptidase)/N-methyltransferase